MDRLPRAIEEYRLNGRLNRGEDRLRRHYGSAFVERLVVEARKPENAKTLRESWTRADPYLWLANRFGIGRLMAPDA